MIRYIKTLGLTLLAVFALGVIGASAASASQFHSELGHTILLGHSSNDKWTFHAGTVACETGTYTGTSNASTITTFGLQPHYDECSGTFGVNVPVHTNKCEFLFHTVSNGHTENTMDIECGDGPQYIAFTSPGCEITVPEQTGLKGITFTNSNPQTDITAELDITNQIKYEEHTKGFFPTCKFDTVPTSNGSYVSNITLEGFDTPGAMTKIWVA